MRRVLVTGATGFVGHVLCDSLARADYCVRAAVRESRTLPTSVSEVAVVGDIGAHVDWREALTGVDCVIHAAARAHVLHDHAAAADLYFNTNELGTRELAKAAAHAGVRRFVYVSSIKVNGGETVNSAYTASDEPRPEDAYGESKWRAEENLRELSARESMQIVIVRPPLVYGPRVRANFLRLMSWVERGVPLPLASVRNRRSLVSIWNLCDLLVHVLSHPAAPGRTWLVSDGEDLSTPQLIRLIADAMQRPARLIPMPVTVLRFVAGMLGFRAEFARLCGSLEVDITATRNELGWSPPLTSIESIRRTAAWYLSEGRRRGA